MKKKPPGEGETPTQQLASEESDNIVHFPGVTRAVDWSGKDISLLLRRAAAMDLKDLVILGIDSEGDAHLLTHGVTTERGLFLSEYARMFFMGDK